MYLLIYIGIYSRNRIFRMYKQIRFSGRRTRSGSIRSKLDQNESSSCKSRLCSEPNRDHALDNAVVPQQTHRASSCVATPATQLPSFSFTTRPPIGGGSCVLESWLIGHGDGKADLDREWLGGMFVSVGVE